MSNRLAGAAPWLFLLHDLEEILQVEAMHRELRELLGPRFPRLAERAALGRRARFGVAAGLFALTTLAVSHSQRRSDGATTLSLVLSVRALNGVAHVAHATAVGRYAPGLATAVPVNLVYSLLTLRALRAPGSSASRRPRSPR